MGRGKDKKNNKLRQQPANGVDTDSVAGSGPNLDGELEKELEEEQEAENEISSTEAETYQENEPLALEPEVEVDEEPDLPKISGLPAVRSELVVYNALEAYLREIRAYPPLSKEEEKALALRYYENKELKAAYEMVTRNLWLVVKIARDYEKAARSLLDLIQEGNIGLMEAVKNFDPYRGVRFPSYAVWWIKAYIIRYVIANWRMVKIGTTQAQRRLFFNLKKEKDRLEREGFYPAPKLIAENLKVRESEVIEMEQRLGGADVSVDAPLKADSDGDLLSILPSEQMSAEDILDQKRIKELISESFEEFAATLNKKELLVFKERMLSEEKVTLQDIAEKVSLSRERVRQIENKIQEKLKTFLVKKFGTSLRGISEF